MVSVLCGVAPALWLLIAARTAQGVGASIMMALTMAFVGETVPKAKTPKKAKVCPQQPAFSR